MAKILLVEDNDELSDSLLDWFTAKGHVIERVSNGTDALQMLSNFSFDVIVLDWMLPGDISGLEICKQFRSKKGDTAIIFLTGKGDIESKESALDHGGDDYLVKPFDIRELAARIRSLLRRPTELLPLDVKLGDIFLDPRMRTLTIGEKSIHLMPKEAGLLEYLMRHPNQPINAPELLKAVWPSESDASPETVRTWMKNLRQKLNGAGKADLIKTIPGAGYVIEYK